MALFEYVLILLGAIFLSNFIHRFVPAVSVPIIQIALGALIALIPTHYRMELEPDLFFVLFIAPLIFYNSMMADKHTLWKLRKPILNMSIILVFVTAVVMGYGVHLLIPAIPLAAAFALVGALGPTDDVAVLSVSKRVNVPPKLMRILEGESIINDASGIVCFQFALAAMLTGSFSLVEATGRFFVIGLGGIAVGLLCTWLKYVFVKWLRTLGMENVTLHILIGILTPFAIYLIAEGMGVSGILAIFAAGIAHSFQRNRLNPSTVNLKIASDSIWSVLAFTIEGMVFLILGTQLPHILSTVSQGAYSIGTWEIIGYVFLITAVLLGIRFLWSFATIRPAAYADTAHPVSRLRASVIFSLSGARGAVTLSTVLSIPLMMGDGSAFPERDLLILLACGVILVSLVVTNFLLPLCVEKKAEPDGEAENAACVEILQQVISTLKGQATPENRETIAVVTGNYYSRLSDLQRKHTHRSDREAERLLKIRICEWEKEYVSNLEREGADAYICERYVYILEKQIDKLSRNPFRIGRTARRSLMHFLKNSRQFRAVMSRKEMHVRFLALVEGCNYFVLERLRGLLATEDTPALRKVTAAYAYAASMRRKRGSMKDGTRREADNEAIAEITSRGFQIERDCIQTMIEAGRISHHTAREMRQNISLSEVQWQKDSL